MGVVALVLLAAVVLLAGFGGAGNGTFTGTKTYRDDFSNANRWPVGTSAKSTYGVYKNTYVIVLKKASHGVFVQPISVFGPIESPKKTLADSRQQVGVISASSTGDDMTTGLMCRWNRHLKTMSAYVFHIRSREQGPQWTIARFVNGKPKVLRSGRGNFNLKKVNLLEATCNGDTLTFKVNRQQVAEVHDSAIKAGLNALVGVAVAKQKPPLIAAFDNYELSY